MVVNSATVWNTSSEMLREFYVIESFGDHPEKGVIRNIAMTESKNTWMELEPNMRKMIKSFIEYHANSPEFKKWCNNLREVQRANR